MHFPFFPKTRRGTKSRSALLNYRPRLEAMEDRCLLSAGQLDPTFGSGGLVTIPIYDPDFYGYPGILVTGTAMQTDGKIIAGGNFGIYRFTANGDLDTVFRTSMGVRGLAVYPKSGTANDGKIMAAGDNAAVGGTVLARFNPSGLLDLSFGTNGLVSFPVVANYQIQRLGRVAFQPDGKFIVEGSGLDIINHELHPLLFRFNADATLDISFGSSGVAVVPVSAPNMILQSDGKIVLAGSDLPTTSSLPPTRFTVAHYNADGTPDQGFGSNQTGIVSLPPSSALGDSDSALAVAVQSDGKIVAAGVLDPVISTSPYVDVSRWALARFNPDGTLDSTFGSSGVVTTQLNPSATQEGDNVSAVTLQSDGKIIVAGRVNYWGDPITYGAFGRFNADGTLDDGFNGTGIVITQVGDPRPIGLALQPGTNEIVVAGGSSLVRYTTDLPATPTIAWPHPADIPAGTALSASQLDASAGVPGTFVYRPPAGTVLSAGSGQTLSVTFTPTDTANYTTTTANVTINVNPAPVAAYFTVTAPPNAVTGNPVNIVVQAFDQLRNPATGYTGKVHLTSSDAKATFLPNDFSLTGGVGSFALTLNTPGSQKITASDALSFSPITISGSTTVVASGLKVTALTKTPTGFTATFNQAINPADLTIYGKGNIQQDVLLVGNNSNNSQPYPGTLIVDASKKLITFNASSNFLGASNPGGSAALPDDTYTVTLLSGLGNNGFQDVSGQGLDDGHGGHADYGGTFTTTYQHDKTQVLGIADFARGPNASGDTSTLIKVPNDPANGGHVGIPITIYNAANLTSAGFTLTYNANFLTVTGGISDPSNAAAAFQMTSNVMTADGVHSVATFAFSRATPASGTQILGDITAYVPYAARSQYQVKDLLALGNIAVNGGASVVPANAVDADAYFGDVNGDHHLDGVDKGLIANVASTLNTGFTAFTLLDPAIIGDLSGDNAVTANSTSLLSNYLLALHVAKIPALPIPAIADNLFTSPFAADPTLSLPASVRAACGLANLPIYLDHPRPAGSTGLVEAELTLAYDPAVLSVSAADITFGSIPSQGTGWQLSATVNAATGQISIQLYSETPIPIDQAGSLVNIAFHVKASAGLMGTRVQLMESKTVLADAQAAMILTPGLDWTAVLTSDSVETWTRAN